MRLTRHGQALWRRSFKTTSGEENDGPVAMAVKTADPEATYENGIYNTKNIYVCKHKVAKPRVFIPVFPGTNCEYDSTKAFERAGAEVDVKVFKNLKCRRISVILWKYLRNPLIRHR